MQYRKKFDLIWGRSSFFPALPFENCDLTPLHGERDDDEDGGAVGEVAATLEDGKENVDIKAVSGEVQVVGQDLGRRYWDVWETTGLELEYQ